MQSTPLSHVEIPEYIQIKRWEQRQKEQDCDSSISSHNTTETSEQQQDGKHEKSAIIPTRETRQSQKIEIDTVVIPRSKRGKQQSHYSNDATETRKTGTLRTHQKECNVPTTVSKTSSFHNCSGTMNSLTATWLQQQNDNNRATKSRQADRYVVYPDRVNRTTV